MPEPVDATMDADQQAALQPALDLTTADPRGKCFPASHDPMRAAGDPLQPLLHGPALGTHTVSKAGRCLGSPPGQYDRVVHRSWTIAMAILIVCLLASIAIWATKV